MATFNFFEDFFADLPGGVHDLLGTDDTLKAYLTNNAPSASADSVLADLVDIATGNGYSDGGEDTQNSGAESTGTFTLTGTKIVWTASGGAIAQFRYVPLYNDTPSSPADPLIGWWDYGSALDLADGESFSLKFNNSDTTGTILTIAVA